MSRSLQTFARLAAGSVALLGLSVSARGVSDIHITDGAFSSTGEWNAIRPQVSKTIFAQVGVAGGSVLWVEQGDLATSFADELYLMYDYTSATGSSIGAFFDVFFQVPANGEDYLVRIHDTGGLETFEKPAGTPSNILPSGSFDTGSLWSAMSVSDLTLAGFEGKVGFGPSPDNATPHLMAEFEVTVHVPASNPGGAHPGLYDPAPAFWSASKGNIGSGDPPISSAIFTLNSDGTTTVVPILDLNGAPIQQLEQLPEPTSISLIALGAVGMMARRRRHR